MTQELFLERYTIAQSGDETKAVLLEHYINTLGWGLASLEGKNPELMGKGWQKRPILNPLDFPADMNIGLIHECSKTSTFDIDHPGAVTALAAVGISLDEVLGQQSPYKITGDPENLPKPLYRAPDIPGLKTKQLRWPDPSGEVNSNGTPKLITIFELRGGEGAFQDVLPPSIHPDTKTVYTWVGGNIPKKPEDIPALPQSLLFLWQNWDSLSEKLQKACPWLPAKIQSKPVSQNGNGNNHGFDVTLIQTKFNERYTPADTLERNGYTRRGSKWLCPNSSSGNPGVISLGQGDKVMSFHGSDPLSDGKPHDAYDCYVILEHNGDNSKAWHAAKEELGITFSGTGKSKSQQASKKEVAIDPETGEVTEGTPDSYLLTQSIDDEGNAQCLIAMFPGKFIYCPAYGYMWYNGQRWLADSESILDRHIVEMLKARRMAAVKADIEPLVKFARPNASRLNGCKALLQSLIYTDVSEFDSSPDLLNCANGVVDLRTGEIQPHDPSQFFTYCLTTEYDPNADTSAWGKWILETVVSESVAEYLKLAIGYTLTGHTSEECLFYIQGPTRSGKGTFTETLLALLAKPLSTEVDFMTFTAKRDADSNNFDLAPLKATRFVAASESTDYDFLNDRRIKTLTGGNYISCAFKHKDFFTYRPQFKVWLSSNKPVKASADDDAIWVRVKVIRFPNSHAGKEDKQLKRRFLSPNNLKAVLAWAVQGAIEWYALPNGLETPAEVERETQKERSKNDFIGRFLEECTEQQGGEFTPNEVIRAVYRSWCESNSLKPRERDLFQRLASEALPNSAYLSQSDLDKAGLLKLIKLPEGATTKRFRGYYGLVIPEYILNEYLC